MQKPNLLLINEPRTIRESSMRATVSPVVSPLSSSSPRALKLLNSKIWALQSLITCFNLASMSFSFTAEIQISYRNNGKGQIIKLFFGSKTRWWDVCKLYARHWFSTYSGLLSHLKPNARRHINYNSLYLNIFFIWQQWCLHKISQQEVISFYIHGVSGQVWNTFPMATHHCFVSHHFQ